ncbi:hypothetical protein M445_09735 [Vibrio owensii 47666-1]|nr:hypothetical protein M445_09735 [Vibrio owensii 47666-1]
MLGKPCREKGELEGVASTSPNIQPQTHQPHLTSPCFKLRSSQHAELKGEELVSCSQIVQFTMQHHNALKTDSEYSLRLLQNDDGKALN